MGERCRVAFVRNVLDPLTCEGRTAAIRQGIIRPDRKSAGDVWHLVADQVRPKLPELALRRDEAVLARLALHKRHRGNIDGTDEPEKLVATGGPRGAATFRVSGGGARRRTMIHRGGADGPARPWHDREPSPTRRWSRPEVILLAVPQMPDGRDREG